MSHIINEEWSPIFSATTTIIVNSVSPDSRETDSTAHLRYLELVPTWFRTDFLMPMPKFKLERIRRIYYDISKSPKAYFKDKSIHGTRVLHLMDILSRYACELGSLEEITVGARVLPTRFYRPHELALGRAHNSLGELEQKENLWTSIGSPAAELKQMGKWLQRGSKLTLLKKWSPMRRMHFSNQLEPMTVADIMRGYTLMLEEMQLSFSRHAQQPLSLAEGGHWIEICGY